MHLPPLHLSLRRHRSAVAALRGDKAGGVVLTAGALVALAWANLPGLSATYHQVWGGNAPGSGLIGVGLTWRDWVDQGLMCGFFAGIGLEIRREVTVGTLRTWRRAAVPVLAAVGGMALPALLFSIVSAGGPGRGGWSIPMATDVAFALGALALLGSGISSRARVFLMTLAVADDVLSIVVLVAVASGRVKLWWLAAGLGALVVMGLMRLSRLSVGWPVVVLGAVGWWCFLHAGVEAAVIAVAAGALAPVGRGRGGVTGTGTGQAGNHPGARRWELRLEPLVNAVVLPVFALANAGLSFAGSGLASGAGLRVFAAVVVARLVGKPVGIYATTRVARRAVGAARPGLRGTGLAGVGTVATIGFTVPLLLVRAVFPPGPLAAGATAGLLAASVLGAVAGGAVLRRPARATVPEGSGSPGGISR